MDRTLDYIRLLLILTIASLAVQSSHSEETMNPMEPAPKVLKLDLIKKVLPDSLTLKQLKADPSIGTDFLKDVLKTKKPKTVSEFLSYLPPQYMANYTLVYRSRSLQEGSFQNPRAIVYGSDSRLVIAFNGNESQKRGNTIEVMEYVSEGKKEFRLHEISFNDDRATLSENVQKCTACHRADARPIWDSYAMWPGVYGSLDDLLIPPSQLSRGYEVFGTEYNEYKKWLQQRPDHPRYRWLPRIQLLAEGKNPRSVMRTSLFSGGIVPKMDYDSMEEVYPYLSPQGQSIFYPPFAMPMKGVEQDSYLFRPNTNVASNFSILLAEKVMSQIRETKLHIKYPLVLEEYLKLMNPRQKSGNEKTRLFFSILNEELKQTQQLRRDRLQADTAEPLKLEFAKDYFETDGDYEQAAANIQVFSKFFGIPMDQFSLSFEKNTLNFFVANENMGSLLLKVTEGQRYLSEYKAALRNSRNDDFNRQYQAYQDETGRSLQQPWPFEANFSVSSGSPFRKCLSCHTGPDPVGPAIHFDDEPWLQKLRAKPAAWTLFSKHIMSRINQKGNGRMPMNDVLTQQEKSAIRSYLGFSDLQ